MKAKDLPRICENCRRENTMKLRNAFEDVQAGVSRESWQCDVCFASVYMPVWQALPSIEALRQVREAETKEPVPLCVYCHEVPVDKFGDICGVCSLSHLCGTC